MSDTIFRLEQVRQRYGGADVLTIEEMSVQEGEVLGIVGPSGAGKSTLLRLLNFLEPPQQGMIHFRGACYSAGREMPIRLRRRVTTVFQQPHLLNRSVAANVQYGLRLRGKRDGLEQVESALRQVGLWELARRPARTLSGGEAQRVALARALVIEPEVLLLDEPTANLDPYNVGLIEQIIRDSNQQRNTTIVLVTHNVFQAKRLAHRVGLLLGGRMVEMSETETFFADPNDPRTAAFISGEMVY